MKTKILLWSVVSMLMTGLATRAAETNQSQVITLADGTKLTLLGVTYGKHHVAPNYEEIGGNIRSGNWIDRTNDTTVVWFEIEHDASRWPSYALLVSDEANTACITSEVTTRCHVKNGVEVHGFLLKAFPRWDKKIILRIASAYGQELSREKIIIANPQPGFFGNQKPEPLPVTKSDGDVDVTLTKLVAGAPLPPHYRRKELPPDDLQNKCVRIAFDFKQNGRSVTNWHPWLVDTSDSAGNHVQTTLQYQDNEFMRQHTQPWAERLIQYTTNDDYKGYYFKPGLWPDEPSWKVRLEFVRNSGFNDDEIVTFTNLPVKPGTQQDFEDQWSRDESNTNFSFIAQKKVNGVQLKLLPPLVVPNSSQPGQKYISVIIYADPNPPPKGMQLTVLQATDDQGHDIWSPFAPAWAGHFSIDFPNPRDVKTLNLKLALHKTRFVEFNVKPTKE